MLISRVAEHCFWFGRYLERTEATARSLGSTREAVLGAELEDRASWLPVIIAAGEQERFAELVAADIPDAAEDGELVQLYMVWELACPSSLRASIRAVRFNARLLREHLSNEVWETINELHLWIESARARRSWDDDRHAFYDHISRSMALTAGLLRESMLRDEPLDFIMLGLMLERASQTARIVDVQHHTLALGNSHVVLDTARWLAMLRACAGYDPFMRRHRGRVSGRTAAAFLIQDPRFPRSIGFALEAALRRLAAIRPPEAAELPGERSQARLSKLHGTLQEKLAEDLAGTGIHDVLTHVVDEVHAICEEIGAEFLGHGRAASSHPTPEVEPKPPATQGQSQSQLQGPSR